MVEHDNTPYITSILYLFVIEQRGLTVAPTLKYYLIVWNKTILFFLSTLKVLKVHQKSLNLRLLVQSRYQLSKLSCRTLFLR
jgi:hypothetical protein